MLLGVGTLANNVYGGGSVAEAVVAVALAKVLPSSFSPGVMTTSSLHTLSLPLLPLRRFEAFPIGTSRCGSTEWRWRRGGRNWSHRRYIFALSAEPAEISVSKDDSTYTAAAAMRPCGHAIAAASAAVITATGQDTWGGDAARAAAAMAATNGSIESGGGDPVGAAEGIRFERESSTASTSTAPDIIAPTRSGLWLRMRRPRRRSTPRSSQEGSQGWRVRRPEGAGGLNNGDG
eukprot:g13479.t1